MGPKPMSSRGGLNRKANAAGFAKRQARKAEASARPSADVYEYTSGRNKRAGVTLSLDKDESMGLGPEGDEDAQVNHEVLRARIMNMGEGGDAIDSEDDEEIESDDAFEESDDERFAGFSFANKPSGKTKPRAKGSGAKVHFAEVDLDEGEADHQSQEDPADEELDGDSDEFLDVLDVLDGRGEPDLEDDGEESGQSHDGKELHGPSVEKYDSENSKDEEDEEEDEAQDQKMDDAFAPSDTEQELNDEALDTLGAFVSGLPSDKKRKAEDAAGDESAAPAPVNKRRMLKERTEAGAESEFGVHASAGLKLQLEDLLAPLPSSSALLALKKSTKPLTKGDALAAPLPQRTQDRLDREAAYEQTKGEADKWKATMKRIKEADHLSFPLQVPQKINPSNSELAAKFKPSTPLESAVDKLLRAANLRDESSIAETESLKLNHLSVEEVAARRKQLRTMRELMFRAEAKAKRVAKIKSKTYRKIQRKARERVKGLVAEAEGAGGGAESDGEERMRREVERARERATLRHKNTGKWARAMKGRGELDVDQRRDIEEMLEKGEQLRAKIQGDADSEDDDDDDNDVEGIKAGAFEELRRLEKEDVADGGKVSGVFGMKFMQNAMAREARRVGEVADAFRDEMARLGESDDSDGGGDNIGGGGDSGAQAQRLGGRMTFRPGQALTDQATPWPIAPSDSSSTLKSSEPALQSPAVASQHTIRSSPPALSPSPKPLDPNASPKLPPAPAPNPWLQPHSSIITTQSRRNNELVIGKSSAGAERSKHQLQKSVMKGAEEREKAREDAVVEISVNGEGVLTLEGERGVQAKLVKVKGKGKVNGKGKEKEGAPMNGQQVDAAYDGSDTDSEVEAQEEQLKTKATSKGVKAFKQRDLVALAFAGDNVVQDFARLKKREVDADAPRTEDHTLPGWGSWGGAGTRRNPHAKKFIKQIPGISPTSRADHGKPHLIISEKKDKKAAKYLTKDLPYPYTSRAQFERGMEAPIGTEWNTRVGFQRGTLPRVVKKMGVVINPLDKLF